MSSVQRDFLAIIAQLENTVRDLQASGEEVSLFYSAPEPVAQAKPIGLQAPPAVPARHLAGKSVRPEAKAAFGGEVGALAAEVETCTACVLHRDRVQTVLGEGSLEASVVFVGEAPGVDEEREGRPFRGQAGELLEKILASIGLDRSRVYLCNLLKCRLPGNRNPAPEEIAACRGFLKKQLALLRPRLICTLGVFAAQTLLQTQETLSQLRGREHSFQGIPVVPTFHPEALIFHPQNKRQAWEDMKRAAAILGAKPGPPLRSQPGLAR